MLELNELSDKLKDSIDDAGTVKELKTLQEQIKNNKELCAYIDQYHLNPTEELKQKIYSFEETKRYKHLENELNFIILEINSKLKGIGLK